MTNKQGCSQNKKLWPRGLRLVIAILFLSILSCVCVKCGKYGKLSVSVRRTPRVTHYWQIVRSNGYVEPELYLTAGEAQIAAEDSSNEGAILQEVVDGEPTGNSQRVESWDPQADGLPFDYPPNKSYWVMVNEFGRSVHITFEEAEIKAHESWGAADIKEWKRGKPVDENVYHLQAETPPPGLENHPANQAYYEVDGKFYPTIEEARKSTGLVRQYLQGKGIKEVLRGRVKKTIKRSIGERFGAVTVTLILLALFLIGLVMHFKIETRKLERVAIGVNGGDKPASDRLRRTISNVIRWFSKIVLGLILIKLGTTIADEINYLVLFLLFILAYLFIEWVWILVILSKIKGRTGA